MARKQKSKLLAAVHETASGLQKAGLLDEAAMREFDALCLASSRERESAGLRRAVEEGLSELDAGLEIRGEEIEAWVESWDTENELPPPEPRRRS